MLRWLLLLLLALPALAQEPVQLKQLGQVEGPNGVLQVWLARSDHGKACILKVLEAGKDRDASVMLTGVGVSSLQNFCQQALNYHKPMKAGDIVLLGSLRSLKAENVSGADKVEVAIGRWTTKPTFLLVCHEGSADRSFSFDRKSFNALQRLLQKALAAGV